jgi:sec-independent protein translocase protein TatA
MFRNPSTDLLVVLVIVLLFFGPKRLPGLGRSIGSGIREFKDGLSSRSQSEDEDHEEIPSKSESGNPT